MKTERLRPPKEQKQKSYVQEERSRIKAPGDTKSLGPGMSTSDTKSEGPETSGPSVWSEADVSMAYHRRRLDKFLGAIPSQRLLISGWLLEWLGEPVSTMPRLRMIKGAITVLVTFVRVAGMVLGRLEREKELNLGFGKISKSL